MEDGILSAFGPPILAFERMVLGIEMTSNGEMQSHWKVIEGGARGSEGIRGAKLVDVRQRFENVAKLVCIDNDAKRHKRGW